MTSDSASTLTRPRRAACAVLTLLIAAAVLPAMAVAEEQPAEDAKSEEVRRFRFTPDGAKEIVITPKQKARREERRAKRKARHAAEAEARAKAAAGGQPPAPAAAAKPPAAGDAAGGGH